MRAHFEASPEGDDGEHGGSRAAADYVERERRRRSDETACHAGAGRNVVVTGSCADSDTGDFLLDPGAEICH